MQLNPRIVASLPVIVVRILANLLVKLAELRVRGGHRGSGSGEYTRERLVRSPTRGYLSDGRAYETNETNETIMRL